MSTFVNLLDVVYPVGSVVQSWSSTSPATTFGGTWAQIKESFLYPSSSSGSTGGSSTHNHHWFLGWLEWYGTHPSFENNDATICFESMDGPYGTERQNNYLVKREKSVSKWPHTNAASVSSGTATQPSSAMMECATTDTSTLPPYTTCYCWRRTA